MKKETVEFDAHKKMKVPVDVSFRTKDGDRVRFPAHKKEKVEVHVKFKAKPKQ